MNPPIDQKHIPHAYLITFTTYGTRLHGSNKQSVDKNKNQYGESYLPVLSKREECAKKRMIEDTYLLGLSSRDLVLDSLINTCRHKSWNLLAAHVRTNHIHLVVSAAGSVEKIMQTIKAYASRELNKIKKDKMKTRYWTRHGSTRYLWRTEDIVMAIRYVLLEQGASMAMYDSKQYSLELTDFT